MEIIKKYQRRLDFFSLLIHNIQQAAGIGKGFCPS